MAATKLVNTSINGYQPLNSYDKDIRVIRMAPTASTSQHGQTIIIRCLTEIVTFDERNNSSIPYRALSYTWGDPSATAPISLDGRNIHVTENLVVALHHLSRRHPGDRFWIDAICIDQANEIEKSKQVAMMGTIFKRALEVIVWIGPCEEGSTEAMHILREVGEACQGTLQYPSSEPLSAGMERKVPIGETDDNILLQTIGYRWFPHGVPSFNPAFITRIFQRPWFRRVWVIQEAAVNDNVIFHCGNDTISKATLWAGGQAIIALMNSVFNQSKAWILDDPLWQTLSGASFISRRTMDLVSSSEGEYTLEQLLLRTSSNLGLWSYEASDPRDRLYAIMGLSSDLSLLGIYSDYEKPCRDVYTEAAEAILTKSGTIDILYAVSRPRNVKSIPSWVPDWSTSVPASFGLRQLGRFYASGKGSIASPIFSSDLYGNRIMTLSGYRVDRVKTMLRRSQYSSLRPSAEYWTAAREIVDLFEELSQMEMAAYRTLDSRKEALWRTPIADCDAAFNIKRKYRPTATVRMRESYNALMALSSTDTCLDFKARAYLHVMELVSARRRLFVSRGGYIGLGADTMRSGDIICLLFGGDSPLILREAGSGCYRLVGEAYVHGIMYGELSSLGSTVQEFRLC